MYHRCAFFYAAAIFFLACCVQPVNAQSSERPNIVLVMSDDMGFSDLGCYGGEINTPVLDSLAHDGIRFTQFYNTGRCCPTRASLLSGLYPHQAGVGHMMNDRGYDGYRGDLNRNCVTIAEALRPAGYSTYAVGKWHVARDIQPDGPKHNWPRQRGFDRFYGTITGAGSFFDPGTLARDNTMISPFADSEYQPDQYYYTDAISDHAVRFIEDHGDESPDKPFFMYVAYTAAHWPMHALEKDIVRYKGRYDRGYGTVRAERVRRVRELGLVDPDWQVSPLVGNWDEFSDQQWEARNMEVYAAMIDNMDQGIGRIVKSLKAQSLFDNTLILFVQDNGGCQEGVGRKGDATRPATASLPSIARDAIRLDVIPKQNRRGIPTLQGPGIMAGPEDTYIAYGINWANVSNTPFREYKHFVHEGGISTPLIAHWPQGIQRRGQLENQPGHLIDIMATCVELSRAQYPESVKGESIKPMEGVSLVPTFSGKNLNRSAPLFWEHEGNRAIRLGKWKLVAKENRPWELYDMEVDRTETNDLATQKPDIALKLSAKWDAYARRANVLPLGAWRANNPKTSFNRKQKQFDLQPGADLGQAKAPFIAGKPFTVSVKVSAAGEGVVVAQGGSAHGYAVYVRGGKLCFAVRRQGKLHVVQSSERVPRGAFEAEIHLNRRGQTTIRWEDRITGAGSVSSTLAQMPIDGLQVGRDSGGAVGDYQSPNEFEGKIESVRIRIGPLSLE